MAVVTAGANVALDMYNFEIGDLDGLRTYAGTGRIELKHGEGDYTDVYGDFYYDGFGEVYAGSVYEIETSYYGSLDYSITGLNLYADDFFDWVYSNDTDYAFSVMFAGADTFYGSDKADWLEGFGGNDRMYGYGGVDNLFGGTGSDYLDGGAGGDYMAGGLGDDVYIVATWDDRVAEAAGEGVDLVYSAVAYSLEGSYVEDLTLTGSAGISATGSSYNNILIGNSGSNYIDGKGGADYMEGGAGHDVYVVDNMNDRVVEKSGEGVDLVYSSVAYSLEGSYVEDLTLTGTAGVSAEGSSFDNILTGNAGSNFIDGKGGADYMEGGAGHDVYVVDNVNDRVVERSGEGIDLVRSSIAWSLEDSFVEDLTLTGTAGVSAVGNGFDNILTGNSGSNFIDGKGGADYMEGGAGHDVYVVDNAGDRVVEKSGEGVDLVRSSIAWSLEDSFVEDLTLTGTANVSAVGNGFDNILTGNSGNNFIDGKGGADFMEGGAGHDVYVVDNAGDQVVEAANQGLDLVRSAISFTLGANIEDLTLTGSANTNGTGNSLVNILEGNSGNNILNGLGGADYMEGFLGNDTYYVDNAADVLVEAKNGGTDTVFSSVSFVLKAGSYVENLTLTGSADIHATGNGIANTLTGNAGKNALDGGKGADRMVGGAGDDTYYVDSKSDVVIEAKGSGTGKDHVYASSDYSIVGQYVEYLTLTGSADIYAKGNGIDNRLVGNAGDNRINGMGGQDRLTGGGGSDTFIWDATSHSKVSDSDRITDLSSNDFIDLSRIDANVNASGTQHFTLVDAFTNTAGQVTLSFDGTFTNLRADTNGDGVADMLVRIDGDHEDFDNFIFGG